MFSLDTTHRFLLYRGITDFRKGFDGLSGLVRNELGRDPASGEVYVFINRRRNRIKLLQWQQGGFVMYYKRLEKGTFTFTSLSAASGSSMELSYAELVMMIQGISVEKITWHRRYKII